MASDQSSSGHDSGNDTVFSSLFAAFVLPDLVGRIDRGELSKPFPISDLRGIQVVFFPDGRRPSVRINSEVKAIAQVKPRPEAVFDRGDPVSFDQIDSFGAIGLTDEEADYGHTTFIRTPDGWVGYFDFVYYKGSAQRHVEVADQFLYAARCCREAAHWAAFADNLFSAAELAAKAALLCLDFSDDVVKTKKHQFVKAEFNRQRHIGNVDPAHATGFNQLWELRQAGRYVEKPIVLADADADRLMLDVEALIESARSMTGKFAH